MEKIKYEDIKLALDDEAKKYQLDEAKEIRWSVSKLQADIAYFQYRIFLIQQKISELNSEYQRVIGVLKDEKSQEVSA